MTPFKRSTILDNFSLLVFRCSTAEGKTWLENPRLWHTRKTTTRETFFNTWNETKWNRLDFNANCFGKYFTVSWCGNSGRLRWEESRTGRRSPSILISRSDWLIDWSAQSVSRFLPISDQLTDREHWVGNITVTQLNSTLWPDYVLFAVRCALILPAHAGVVHVALQFSAGNWYLQVRLVVICWFFTYLQKFTRDVHFTK